MQIAPNGTSENKRPFLRPKVYNIDTRRKKVFRQCAGCRPACGPVWKVRVVWLESALKKAATRGCLSGFQMKGNNHNRESLSRYIPFFLRISLLLSLIYFYARWISTTESSPLARIKTSIRNRREVYYNFSMQKHANIYLHREMRLKTYSTWARALRNKIFKRTKNTDEI